MTTKNAQLPSGITPKQIKHDLRASSIGRTSISQIKQELGNKKTNKQKKLSSKIPFQNKLK